MFMASRNGFRRLIIVIFSLFFFSKRRGWKLKEAVPTNSRNICFRAEIGNGICACKKFYYIKMEFERGSSMY